MAAKFTRKIRVGRYRMTISAALSRWRKTQSIPLALRSRFDEVDGRYTLSRLLVRIRRELYKLYGDKRDYARSLCDSRLTPLPEMLRRGMVSCGALVVIYGGILRSLGIPVKFIHGRLRGTRREDRHAWLEVYDPNRKKWISIDLTRHNFALPPRAIKLKECVDWLDLKLKCSQRKPRRQSRSRRGATQTTR